MSDPDDSPLEKILREYDGPEYECGPPTPEEREALAAIIRADGGPELGADATLSVLRRYTADDLRNEADAIVLRFERGDPGN